MFPKYGASFRLFLHRRWCSVEGGKLVPYSLSDFMGAKIEKPSAFHNGEGRTNLTLQNATCLLTICQKRITTNIVDMNGTTKPLPVMLSRRAYNGGGSGYGK